MGGPGTGDGLPIPGPVGWDGGLWMG